MSYRREPRARAPKFPQSSRLDAANALMQEAMATASIGRTSTREDGFSESKPRVVLALGDDGCLEIEITEPTGLKRTLPLHQDPERALAVIHRVLSAQREIVSVIGLASAPTQGMVRDWSKQVIGRDDAARSTRVYSPRAKLAFSTTQTAEELGL